MVNNKIKIIISIVSTIMLLLGGTYAAYTFFTEKTSVTMMVGGDQISLKSGANITVDKMYPVYSMEQGIMQEIEIYKDEGGYTAGIDLYLNLKVWSTAMSSSSFRWALYKNDSYLFSGNFSSVKQSDNIKLTSYTQKINLAEDKDTYALYMWIDAYQESNINMKNQSFTVNLYGQTTFYNGNEEAIVNEVEPNPPELADGMIPIKYNYQINEWVKADTSNTKNDWYDYYNKMWANAVTVTTNSREKYMNAEVGTTVSEDDILAYYVWIPRYKYLLFNTEFVEMDPVEIQIEFQKETDEIFNGIKNGEFLTHPAFWWDNNSDGIRDVGEELAGIWVAKFEITGTWEKPTIKPNVSAIKSGDLNSLFNVSRKLNNINYLTNIGSYETDSHPIKNLEWGAVAYLSHSKYGKNSIVYGVNGYSNYRTGTTGSYTYNDFYIKEGNITSSKNAGSGTNSSTTGNVYGIYGIVGGVLELVAGGISSGFAPGYAPDLNSAGTKYYDLYEKATGASDYSNSKLGDAMGETNRWYGEQANSVGTVAANNVYRRSSLFAFTSTKGHTYSKDEEGTRVVLIIP